VARPAERMSWRSRNALRRALVALRTLMNKSVLSRSSVSEKNVALHFSSVGDRRTYDDMELSCLPRRRWRIRNS
jgi:hypothetical protein